MEKPEPSPRRRKPRADWLVLKPGAHQGYIDWDRAEAIRTMVSENVPTTPSRGRPSTVRRCWPVCCAVGVVAGKLTVQYTGAKGQIPRYACIGHSVLSPEPGCIGFGGLRVDDVVESALLSVVQPAAVGARRRAEQTCSQRDDAREAMVRDFEAVRYAADRAFSNTMRPIRRTAVAGELEARWNYAPSPGWPPTRRGSPSMTPPLRPSCRRSPSMCWPGTSKAVWSAPTTDVRLKKRIIANPHPRSRRRYR